MPCPPFSSPDRPPTCCPPEDRPSLSQLSLGIRSVARSGCDVCLKGPIPQFLSETKHLGEGPREVRDRRKTNTLNTLNSLLLRSLLVALPKPHRNPVPGSMRQGAVDRPKLGTGVRQGKDSRHDHVIKHHVPQRILGILGCQP